MLSHFETPHVIAFISLCIWNTIPIIGARGILVVGCAEEMCLFGLFQRGNRETRRKNELGNTPISVDLSVQLKDITVRIIHPSGREELYQNEIPASELMEKYPGMCVARPEIFRYPHESLLSVDEKLLLGYKYYIIPSTAIQKLKRKHSEKHKVKDSTEGKEVLLNVHGIADAGGDCPEESVCSAKDFYLSREIWPTCLQRKCPRGKKPFVPPIQKPRKWRELDWEPRLASVQEISP